MIVLVPLLSGKESDPVFVESITSKATKIILLQIVDKGFMGTAGTAMGEVMHFRSVMNEVKRQIGLKKKTCEEVTEWGTTTKKILSLAILQKVDKVVLVKQNNKFFEEVVEALEKEKVNFEIVNLPEPVKEKKKLF
ncbi:MAG: hypothetical protein AABW59_01560 [archaeon]